MSLKMLMITESNGKVPGIYVFMQINWGCKIKVQVKTPLHTALIKILNLQYIVLKYSNFDIKVVSNF